MAQTVGQKLQAFRQRAGMSLDQLAKRAGYAGASSVQVYFDDQYNPEGGLSLRVARRFASAMAKRGDPPIEEAEVLDLIQFPIPPYSVEAPEVTPPVVPTPTLRGRPKDVPVYGTALGADIELSDDGSPRQIELTTVDMGEVLAYVRRPPGLDEDRKVYAVFVVGSSMEPRYRAGDPVFVDPNRPPSIGDDVIVQVARPDGNGGIEIAAGLIKTLTRRSSRTVELEQYNPGTRFAIDTERVAAIHRIIPWRECFGM